MATINPTPIPAAPPAPDRGDRATFAGRSEAWVEYQKTQLIPAMNQIAADTYTNAQDAASSAGSASSSASAATTAAGTATTKAGEAGTSAAIAVAALLEFQKRYLGEFATAPTTGPGGSALLEGAIYWNTVSNEFFVWDGAQWQEGVIPAGDYLTANGTATLTNKTLQGMDVTDAIELSGSPGTSGHALLSQGPGLPPVWGPLTEVQVYQVFSAQAAAALSVSGGNVIYTVATSPNAIGGGPTRRATGGALGVFLVNASHGFAYSTADGDTYTARALPSSAIWRIAANDDGTRWMLTVGGAATVAVSSNGTTYSSGTALPGNSLSIGSYPVAGVGDTWIMRAASGTSDGYRSMDHGASWSAITFPAASLNELLTVGGLFVAYGTGTTYRTSATGDTGSWTNRTVPGGGTGFAALWKSEVGKLYGAISGGTGGTYVTTDGINWTLVPGSTLQSTRVVVHGSVPVTTQVGAVRTFHAGRWQERQAFPDTNRVAEHAIVVGDALIFSHNSTADVSLFVMRTTDADAVGVFRD
jgi:hypothetical protein